MNLPVEKVNGTIINAIRCVSGYAISNRSAGGIIIPCYPQRSRRRPERSSDHKGMGIGGGVECKGIGSASDQRDRWILP